MVRMMRAYTTRVQVLALILCVTLIPLGQSLAADDGRIESSKGAPTDVRRLLGDRMNDTAVGGYGELHYNSPNGDSDVLDFHRFIFYITHRFSDKLHFVSEVELEHALVSDGEGELELEQAYISYNLFENFHLRTGIQLIPLGYINRFHEPPTFFSVERPEFEKVIIPSTWFEAGASALWTPTPDFQFVGGVFGGLDATGFKSKDGLRGGRQKGYETNAENLAVAGRVDYLGIEHLHLALGFYNGNSNQTQEGFGSARVTGGTFEFVSYGASYGVPQNEIRIEGALFAIEGSEKISAANGDSVPGRIWGFYVEDAYDLFAHVDNTEGMNLYVFGRFEYLRGQSNMQAGVIADQTRNREKFVFGLSFKPDSNVSFKIDYEWIDDRSSSNPPDQWNLGIAYMF